MQISETFQTTFWKKRHKEAGGERKEEEVIHNESIILLNLMKYIFASVPFLYYLQSRGVLLTTVYLMSFRVSFFNDVFNLICVSSSRIWVVFPVVPSVDVWT